MKYRLFIYRWSFDNEKIEKNRNSSYFVIGIAKILAFYY